MNPHPGDIKTEIWRTAPNSTTETGSPAHGEATHKPLSVYSGTRTFQTFAIPEQNIGIGKPGQFRNQCQLSSQNHEKPILVAHTETCHSFDWLGRHALRLTENSTNADERVRRGLGSDRGGTAKAAEASQNRDFRVGRT
jgi:hypothetical protein